MKLTVLRIRIRDPGSGAFLTPGSGIEDVQKVSIRIRDEQPGSYILELKNHFFPGSEINIPDPQHWKLNQKKNDK
jgi:hypothetical protein